MDPLTYMKTMSGGQQKAYLYEIVRQTESSDPYARAEALVTWRKISAFYNEYKQRLNSTNSTLSPLNATNSTLISLNASVVELDGKVLEVREPAVILYAVGLCITVKTT